MVILGFKTRNPAPPGIEYCPARWSIIDQFAVLRFLTVSWRCSVSSELGQLCLLYDALRPDLHRLSLRPNREPHRPQARPRSQKFTELASRPVSHVLINRQTAS